MKSKKIAEHLRDSIEQLELEAAIKPDDLALVELKRALLLALSTLELRQAAAIDSNFDNTGLLRHV